MKTLWAIHILFALPHQLCASEAQVVATCGDRDGLGGGPVECGASMIYNQTMHGEFEAREGRHHAPRHHRRRLQHPLRPFLFQASSCVGTPCDMSVAANSAACCADVEPPSQRSHSSASAGAVRGAARGLSRARGAATGGARAATRGAAKAAAKSAAKTGARVGSKVGAKGAGVAARKAAALRRVSRVADRVSYVGDAANIVAEKQTGAPARIPTVSRIRARFGTWRWRPR